MKKVLTVITAVCLVVCQTLTVFSDGLVTGGRPDFLNFYYELEWNIDQNGVLTISDDVTALPSFGSSWGEYGPWRDNSAITKVIIPDTVTSIGGNLFENCTNLKEVVLPKNLELIGNNAFLGCNSIEKITISDENTNFKTIDGVLFDNMGQKLIWYPVGSTAREYTIPDGTVEIADRAFWKGINLEKINFPNSVTKIGLEAFVGCVSLDNLLLPDTLTYMGAGAFSNCEKLENIKMPNYVYLQGNPFYKSAFYNNEANWDGDGLYMNKHLICVKNDVTEFEIKPDTVSIAGQLFPKTITKITIPGSVKCIGDRAFYYTKRIDVQFEEGLEILGDSAFYYSSIESVTLPDSLKVIGNDAFSNCYNLESISLGDGVTQIGESAFAMCSELKEITIPDSVKTIGGVGRPAFNDCSDLHTIRIGSGLEEFSNVVYSCRSLSTIEISENNPCLSVKNNVVFNKTGENLIYYPQGKKDDEYTIPDNVKVIEEDALRDASFKKLTIPVSVEKISEYNYCNFITDIYYMGTKEDWDKIEIFEYNTKIKEAMLHFNDGSMGNVYENLRFYEEEDKVYIIGLADENAADISIPGEINGKSVEIAPGAFKHTPLVTVELDERIKTIPSEAFSFCSKLENINLDYVEHIGSSAFEYCPSLKEINLLNIKSWSGITEKELDLEKRQLKLYYHQTLYYYDTSSRYTVFYESNIDTLRIKWPEENFDKEATMLPALFMNCNVEKVIFENFTISPSLAEFMGVNISGNQHRFDDDMDLSPVSENLVIYGSDEKTKEYAEKIGVPFVDVKTDIITVTDNSNLDLGVFKTDTKELIVKEDGKTINTVTDKWTVDKIIESISEINVTEDEGFGLSEEEWKIKVFLYPDEESLRKDEFLVIEKTNLGNMRLRIRRFNQSMELLEEKNFVNPDYRLDSFFREAVMVPILMEGQKDNINWILTKDGVLTVNGTGAMGEKGWVNNWVTKAVIGEGITDVNLGYHYNVTEVQLPDSLKKITSFVGCEKLESITIPENVSEIYGFEYCDKLKYVNVTSKVPVRIGISSFCISDGARVYLPDTVYFIEDYAFTQTYATMGGLAVRGEVKDLTIIAPYESYAYNWAKGKGINVETPEPVVTPMPEQVVLRTLFVDTLTRIAQNSGGMVTVNGNNIIVQRDGRSCLIANDTVYYMEKGVMVTESLYKNEAFLYLPVKALESVLGEDARKSAKYKAEMATFNSQVKRTVKMTDTSYGTIVEWATGGVMHSTKNELTYIRWDGESVKITNRNVPHENEWTPMTYEKIKISEDGTKAFVIYPKIDEDFIRYYGEESLVLRKKGTTVVTVDLVNCTVDYNVTE